MNVDEIREYCIAFPRATENLQWGDDLCFKIRDKIFVTVALKSIPQKVCFKCTPETFSELLEREDIRPAPYVGRYKWVILDRLDALSNSELKELIRQSYEIVATKTPESRVKNGREKSKGAVRKTRSKQRTRSK